ncbi:MAG TPA: squalene synthase HpnC [Thermoguttaceae bacterium]|nr:squalene synthase HpnC [Thermoguttaceae bacterium]
MFADELQQYGPQSTPHPPPTPAAARSYCDRLARRHYENFTVATRLLPRALRQHFCNVYAYCRWADDLADETGDSDKSLELLDWWESELRDCYQGKVRHPVFVALADTIDEFEIPIEPFIDLLVAFRQDQRVNRYEHIEQLREYCRYSANPVGRLVLYLGRCHSPERVQWSDSICTGLQLANFCQDVARDFDAGRIYLPLAECRRFGYDESDFSRRECNEAFRRLLAAQVEQADGMLRDGTPLIAQMPPELRLSVALFQRGGLAILDAIRRRDYDVWTVRPTLSKMEKLRIVAGCWWQLRRGTFPQSGS